MDDRSDDSTRPAITTRALAVVAATVLAGMLAVEAFGTGVVPVLLVLAVAGVLLTSLREHGLRLPGRPAPEPVAEPEPEDHWHSERWFAETVERGLRALEAWRLDQDPRTSS